MARLGENPSKEDLVHAINDLYDKLEQERPRRRRDRRSTRQMMPIDAWRVKYGDLCNDSHSDAAKKLGLSYGQVYSARGEFTFRDIQPDSFDAKDIPSSDRSEETQTKGRRLS